MYDELVSITKNCRASFENQPPKKKSDPSCFNITCSIDELFIKVFFSDLGPSIDLMPISTFKMITCLKIKPWDIVVELVDSSIAYRYNIVEDAFF